MPTRDTPTLSYIAKLKRIPKSTQSSQESLLQIRNTISLVKVTFRGCLNSLFLQGRQNANISALPELVDILAVSSTRNRLRQPALRAREALETIFKAEYWKLTFGQMRLRLSGRQNVRLIVMRWRWTTFPLACFRH